MEVLDRRVVIDKFVSHLPVKSKNRIQSGHGGISIVLSIKQQQLRLRKIDIGKAQIERRLEFVLRQ